MKELYSILMMWRFFFGSLVRLPGTHSSISKYKFAINIRTTADFRCPPQMSARHAITGCRMRFTKQNCTPNMHAVMLYCHPDVRRRSYVITSNSLIACIAHWAAYTKKHTQICTNSSAMLSTCDRYLPARAKQSNSVQHPQPTSHQQPSAAIAGEKARQNRFASRAESWRRVSTKNFIREITLE